MSADLQREQMARMTGQELMEVILHLQSDLAAANRLIALQQEDLQKGFKAAWNTACEDITKLQAELTAARAENERQTKVIADFSDLRNEDAAAFMKLQSDLSAARANEKTCANDLSEAWEIIREIRAINKQFNDKTNSLQAELTALRAERKYRCTRCGENIQPDELSHEREDYDDDITYLCGPVKEE